MGIIAKITRACYDERERLEHVLKFVFNGEVQQHNREGYVVCGCDDCALKEIE
jgi:hypothetical protein